MPDQPSSLLPDPSVLTGVVTPPFARLPDPKTLFSERAYRFNALAEGHPLKPYLIFLRDLVWLQHELEQEGLPEPEMPEPATLARASEFGMPPLDRAAFEADGAFAAIFDRLMAGAREFEKPEAAAEALERAAKADRATRMEMAASVLDHAIPVEDMAAHVYVAAALQLHYARLAARLDKASLKPVGDGACPSCGGPPVASLVVGWPDAHGARYCACSLCGTLWNYVRVRCVTCGSTAGIGLQEVEGGPGTIKAETCDTCHTYVKVLYQQKDEQLEAVADDVGSLALDLLMRDGPYRRAAFNPFLLGY